MDMRTILFTLALLWMALCTSAQANCDSLLRSIDLAEQTFGPNQTITDEALFALNHTIKNMNNDEILLLLRRSGQGSAFGDLRNFLTQLRLAAQFADADGFTFTPRMERDLRSARRIVNTACYQDGDINRPIPATQTNAQLRTEDRPARVGDRLKDALQNKGLLSASQRAYLDEQFNFRLLGALFASLMLVLIIAVGIRYSLLILLIMRRNRRICEIPATLTCMMTSVPGNLTIVGRYGCRFTPTSPKEMEAVAGTSTGTYCKVEVNGREINGKLMEDISANAKLLYSEPKDRPELAWLFQASVVPPRYDFSVLRAERRRIQNYDFGNLFQR